MSERVYNGTILVYDRQARTAVVEAFRLAGWRPMPRLTPEQRVAMQRATNDEELHRKLMYQTRGYEYLSRAECDGDTARYMTSGTREEVVRLSEALRKVPQGGFEAYVSDELSR